MIDLRGRFPDEPEEFRVSKSGEELSEAQQRGRAKLKRAKQKISGLVERGTYPRSEDFETLWRSYKHLFDEPQFGIKCAYCEDRFGAAYPGDVEHYRPRSEVKEPKTSGNRDDTIGKEPGRKFEKPSRPGYWWLAYTWSNFLCVCNKCNTWKGSSFPLRAPRKQMKPGVERQEQPLLLNPYLTDPSNHLSFDEVGQIRGKTPEGKITVDRCGLDRESLRRERGRTAAALLEVFEDFAEEALPPEPALKYLLGFCGDAEPFAGMARHLVAQKFGMSVEDIREVASGVGT